MEKILALSPLDGRYSAKTAHLSQIFSEYGLIKSRLFIEIQWFKMVIQLSEVQLPHTKKPVNFKLLDNIFEKFSITAAESVKSIEKTTNHDVKAVEYYLIEQLEKNHNFKPWVAFIHWGCTSEDINNLAYATMVASARQDILLPLMLRIIDFLADKAVEWSNIAMLSRTHGQPATPTTLGKEIAIFVARLRHQYNRFKAVKIYGKFNGATGNYNAHTVAMPNLDWLKISENFIESLGLSCNLYTTQIEPHDWIVELLQALTHFNLILINLTQDLWGYISRDYFIQKTVAHHVGSSTMPHKINPIDFENAEGNLGMANSFYNYFINKLPISRFQRDLSDSTVLRNLGSGFGHSLLSYKSILRGLNNIDPNIDIINQDLADRWEVLTEAVQTVLRSTGFTEGYELLKTMSRGKKITKTLLHDFIDQMNLPYTQKILLKSLTPQKYIGLATELANSIKL